MTGVTPARRHHIYEKLVEAFYTAMLAPGGSFIDVGANVGHHAIRMARCVTTTGRGVAIEPIPRLAEQVRTLLANEGLTSTSVVETAVSDTPGSAEFFVREDFLGWSSMFEDHVRPDDDKEPQVIHVPVTTLDALASDQGLDNIDCIKLDIEHSEFNALKGARSILTEQRPTLVYENSPKAAASINGYSLDEFFSFFDDLEYRLYTILLDPFDRDFVAAATSRLPIYYLGVPVEHAFARAPHDHFDVSEARAELTDGW